MKTSLPTSDLIPLREKDVVLFGAGDHGAVALRVLQERGVAVRCFCDNSALKQGTVYLGLPVLAPKELKTVYPHAVVFIASLYLDPIAEQLDALGISDYRDCSPLFTGLDCQTLKLDIPQDKIARDIQTYLQMVLHRKSESVFIVKNLDVVVTEQCSLRCRDCANLMQFYEHPNVCNVERLFAALDRFMMVVDRLLEFRVLGGEPLLVKMLPEILSRLTAYENCDQIVVLTNGTILPKPELVQSFKHEKIVVQVTNYKSLSRKLGELIRLLEENGISPVVLEPELWQDCGKIERIERTTEELESLFANCCAGDILTLLHGILYRCPFSAHAENLEAVPLFSRDRLDLLEESDDLILRKRLADFCGKRDFLDACSYCNGRDYRVGKVPAAVQSLRPLPYERRREKP